MCQAFSTLTGAGICGEKKYYATGTLEEIGLYAHFQPLILTQTLCPREKPPTE